MIPRLLAVWRGRNDVVAGRARYPGYLWRHLLKAARRPADPEPPRTPRWTYGHGAEDVLCECRPDYKCEHNGVHLSAVLDADTAAVPAVDVPPAGEHVGAQDDEATSAFYAALRADDTVTLDPDERAWEEAFRAVEDAIAAEAARGLMRLNRAISKVAPGWREAICGRHDCPHCAVDFDEAMQMAGVIALPAEPVDWGTDQWPVLEVAG